MCQGTGALPYQHWLVEMVLFPTYMKGKFSIFGVVGLSSVCLLAFVNFISVALHITNLQSSLRNFLFVVVICKSKATDILHLYVRENLFMWKSGEKPFLWGIRTLVETSWGLDLRDLEHASKKPWSFTSFCCYMCS